MFFSKLGQGNKKPGTTGTTTIPATGQIRIKKIKVAKPAAPLLPRSGSSTPQPGRNDLDDKVPRKKPSRGSSTPTRRKKNPDLAQFNRVVASNSDTEHDDSTWEADFNKKLSSSVTPPVDSFEDNRELYRGDSQEVKIIESKSLMAYAPYQPCKSLLISEFCLKLLMNI